MSGQRSSGPASSTGRIVLAGAIVAVGAAVVNVGVAAAAVGMGVPAITPLGAPGVVTVSVVAAFAAVIGWNLVRRRAAHPAASLRRVVPVALLISFVPDVLLGAVTAPASGWAPIAALAVMHVTTAAIAVAACARLLPVEDVRAVPTRSERVAA